MCHENTFEQILKRDILRLYLSNSLLCSEEHTTTNLIHPKHRTKYQGFSNVRLPGLNDRTIPSAWISSSLSGYQKFVKCKTSTF